MLFFPDIGCHRVHQKGQTRCTESCADCILGQVMKIIPPLPCAARHPHILQNEKKIVVTNQHDTPIYATTTATRSGNTDLGAKSRRRYQPLRSPQCRAILLPDQVNSRRTTKRKKGSCPKYLENSNTPPLVGFLVALYNIKTKP